MQSNNTEIQFPDQLIDTLPQHWFDGVGRSYKKSDEINNIKTSNNNDREKVSFTILYNANESTEVLVLSIKNPASSVQKITSKQLHTYDDEYNTYGTKVGARYNHSAQNIWFKTAEEAGVFFQKMQSTLVAMVSKEKLAYALRLDDNCISIDDNFMGQYSAILLAAKLLSENSMLRPLINEHMKESPLSHPIKMPFLNPQQTLLSTVSKPSSNPNALFSITPANKYPVVQVSSNSKETIVKSLFEKCLIEPEKANDTVLNDYYINCGITFTPKQTDEQLNLMAAKIKQAGLGCHVLISKIFIEKSYQDLEAWVNTSSSPAPK